MLAWEELRKQWRVNLLQFRKGGGLFLLVAATWCVQPSLPELKSKRWVSLTCKLNMWKQSTPSREMSQRDKLAIHSRRLFMKLLMHLLCFYPSFVVAGKVQGFNAIFFKLWSGILVSRFLVANEQKSLLLVFCHTFLAKSSSAIDSTSIYYASLIFCWVLTFEK